VRHHAVNALFGVLNRVIASKRQAVFGWVHALSISQGLLPKA
jgi:hypothetical protein